MDSSTSSSNVVQRPNAGQRHRSLTARSLGKVNGLRTAVLGYLTEAEEALKARTRKAGPAPPAQISPSPASSTSESTGESSTASAVHYPAGVRLRSAASSPAGRSSPSPSLLLDHLTQLRNDVDTHLSPESARDGTHSSFLRSLPHKLSVVDLGVTAPPEIPDLSSEEEADSVVEEPEAYTEADNVLTPIADARVAVIKMAKSLLPDDHWPGWERLGWENEQARDARIRLRRRWSHEAHAEEEDAPPEYLFPNRTPASNMAMAQRRAARSRSLGSHDQAPLLRRLKSESSVQYGSIDGALTGAVESEAAPLLGTAPLEEVGPSVPEALERSQGGRKLIEYDDLPVIWRNNEHIVTGYRFIPLNTPAGPIPLLKSAFQWHNESINIHSHFIPTLIILALIPLMIRTSPLPDAHWLDTAMIVTYFLSASSCLISSASWHVLSGCASRVWFEWGACVDYIGIAWLIASSFTTLAYNGFYCRPKTVGFYCILNLLCGISGSVLPFQEWFNKRENKKWRISFFLFLCAAMVAPLFQMLYEFGAAQTGRFTAPFATSGWTYVTGLVLYGFHLPECFFPGKFDHIGHSHQLWHVAIIAAVWLHYCAAFTAHAMRLEYSCAAPDAGTPVGVLADRWLQAIFS